MAKIATISERHPEWLSLGAGAGSRILKIRQAAGGACFLGADGGAGWQARPESPSRRRSKGASTGAKLKIWS